jgi:hypothetical protein
LMPVFDDCIGAVDDGAIHVKELWLELGHVTFVEVRHLVVEDLAVHLVHWSHGIKSCFSCRACEKEEATTHKGWEWMHLGRCWEIVFVKVRHVDVLLPRLGSDWRCYLSCSIFGRVKIYMRIVVGSKRASYSYRRLHGFRSFPIWEQPPITNGIFHREQAMFNHHYQTLNYVSICRLSVFQLN